MSLFDKTIEEIEQMKPAPGVKEEVKDAIDELIELEEEIKRLKEKSESMQHSIACAFNALTGEEEGGRLHHRTTVKWYLYGGQRGLVLEEYEEF